jgi:hypothetical protein
MRPTLETTNRIHQISTALVNAKIPVSAIECKSTGFYVVWYYGSSVKESNALHAALRTIEGLSHCKGEDGYLASRGAYITVAL